MTPPARIPDAETAYAALKSALAARPDIAHSALIGIHTGGAWIAERLAADLGIRDIGFLDISFYRDDFQQIGLHPEVKPTAIPFEIDGRAIVLIDDVLFTGRTIRAAMNALFDYGRPRRIDLAVLVDRITVGGAPGDNLTRELPIVPTCAGAAVTLPRDANLVLSRTDGRFQLTVEAC